jgi:hypothetical protein
MLALQIWSQFDESVSAGNYGQNSIRVKHWYEKNKGFSLL